MALEDKKTQPENTPAPAAVDSPASSPTPEEPSAFSTAFAEFAANAELTPTPPSDGTDGTQPAERPNPNEALTETPKQTTVEARTEAPKTPPATDAAPKTSPQASPDKGTPPPLDLSKLPPELRAQVQTLQEQNTALDIQNRRLQSTRSAQGRERARQRQNDDTPPPTDNGDKRPATNGKAPKLDKKALGELVEDLPQLKPLVDHAVESERRLEEADGRLERIVRNDEERGYDENEDELTRRHPDWVAMTSGDAGKAFGRWMLTQPRYLQAASRVNVNHIVDVEVADDILTRYKAEAGIKPPNTPAPNTETPPNNSGQSRRARQLDGSTSVPNRTPSAASGPPADFSAAFDYYAKHPEAVP